MLLKLIFLDLATQNYCVDILSLIGYWICAASRGSWLVIGSFEPISFVGCWLSHLSCVSFANWNYNVNDSTLKSKEKILLPAVDVLNNNEEEKKKDRILSLYEFYLVISCIKCNLGRPCWILNPIISNS